MSITQTANRVRVESAAKNGTLGSQGALNADQIKFDTAITTNNGNLAASPVFRRRHVILREGLSNEEFGMVQSVDGDGVTCEMYADWIEAPASGDAYEVAYRLEDVATIAGCDFETDSRQWVMTKRLIVGTATIAGFLGMSHGQILRLDDRGPGESAFRVGGLGIFNIGTIKNDVAERGGYLIFDNDADDELVMDIILTARARLYEFAMIAARGPEGVSGLSVTCAVTCDVEWSRAQMSGVSSPFKRRYQRMSNVAQEFYITKAEMKLQPMWDGHLKSDIDKTIFDALGADPDTVAVRFLIEG